MNYTIKLWPIFLIGVMAPEISIRPRSPTGKLSYGRGEVDSVGSHIL